MASAARTMIEGLDGRPIFRLFESAKGKLKYPKITLLARGEGQEDQVVVLKVAGDGSKYRGQLMVLDDQPYGMNKFFGRIDVNGMFYATPAASSAVIGLLVRLSREPEAVASEYGKLTGNCCFCLAKLTDDRSIEVGYGPVCAKNYGLTWGQKGQVEVGGMAVSQAEAAVFEKARRKNDLLNEAEAQVVIRRKEYGDAMDELLELCGSEERVAAVVSTLERQRRQSNAMGSL